jgi:hypothetical protein
MTAFEKLTKLQALIASERDRVSDLASKGAYVNLLGWCDFNLCEEELAAEREHPQPDAATEGDTSRTP